MFGNRKKAIGGAEKLAGVAFFDGFSPDGAAAGGRAGRRRRRRSRAPCWSNRAASVRSAT